MTGLIFTAFLIFVVLALAKSANRRAFGVSDYDRLTQKGVRGRGLVLAASSFSVGFRMGTRRFERRAMTLEIEVPGRAPFIVQGTFPVPRGLVEPVPGSSLDVAVDPSGAEKIAVLGPGGFTGPWLNIGPPQAY